MQRRVDAYTYGNVVCMCGIRAHDYEDTDDDAEHVCYHPPSEIRKRTISESCDEGSDEGNEPRKLFDAMISPSPLPTTLSKHQEIRTYAIETVASANGSPTMCPACSLVRIPSIAKAVSYQY